MTSGDGLVLSHGSATQVVIGCIGDSRGIFRDNKAMATALFVDAQ